VYPPSTPSVFHAERVQLEQLAAVVLVQARTLSLLLLLLLLLLPLLLRPHGSDRSQPPSAERANAKSLVLNAQRRAIAVRHAPCIVEIEEHRRALRHCFEDVAELSERAWADDVLVEIHEVVRLGGALRRVDVEVVLPEIGHDFLELTLARDSPRDA